MQDDEREVIPKISCKEDIRISEGTFAEEDEVFISMADIYFLVYKRELDNNSVRRNVPLPI